MLFDIDGTLVQTGGAGQLAFAETFAAEFGVAEISAAVKFAGRSDRAIAMELLDVHGLPTTEDNWRRFRAAYVGRLPDALRAAKGRVLPGVVELLDALAPLPHAAVGLLTGNIREGAETKLDHYGLGDRFAFGGFGDDTNDRCEIAAIALAEAERHAAERNGAGGRRRCGAPWSSATRCTTSAAPGRSAPWRSRCPRAARRARSSPPKRPDLLLDDLSDARAAARSSAQQLRAPPERDRAIARNDRRCLSDQRSDRDFLPGRGGAARSRRDVRASSTAASRTRRRSARSKAPSCCR